jgi:hypothetical protein
MEESFVEPDVVLKARLESRLTDIVCARARWFVQINTMFSRHDCTRRLWTLSDQLRFPLNATTILDDEYMRGILYVKDTVCAGILEAIAAGANIMAENGKLSEMLQELREVLQEVGQFCTHEALDPSLTRKEVLTYQKLTNSALGICAKLDERLKKKGWKKCRDDIFRFVDVLGTRHQEVIDAKTDRQDDSSKSFVEAAFEVEEFDADDEEQVNTEVTKEEDERDD